MVNTNLLIALYLANTIWFALAFFQFSFRQKQAMLSGARRAQSKDAKVRSNPEGDAWHHDLLAYLGGINLALAALALIRLVVLAVPNFHALSAFTTGSRGDHGPLDMTALIVLGIAHYSQTRVNLYVVRNSGRWIMGETSEMITLVDGVLTILDWVAACAIAGSM